MCYKLTYSYNFEYMMCYNIAFDMLVVKYLHTVSCRHIVYITDNFRYIVYITDNFYIIERREGAVIYSIWLFTVVC